MNWMRLSLIKRAMEDLWWIIQAKSNSEALEYAYSLLVLLDLDRKSMQAWFCCANSGRVGRAVANKILWDALVLASSAEIPRDLSHWVTSQITIGRKTFDMPPVNSKTNDEIKYWTWDKMRRSSKEYAGFCGRQVPQVPWYPRKDDRGVLVPPPLYFQLKQTAEDLPAGQQGQ